MSERSHRIGQYGSRFELSYSGGSLEPGKVINDSSLNIGVVSNGIVHPHNLCLRDRDFNPIEIGDEEGRLIYKLDYPGKSGVVLFENSINRRIVGNVVTQSLNRPVDRRDKLHVATVGIIENAGWRVYWAPLPGSILHVRIVPNSALSGYYFSEEEAEALCGVLRKVA